MNWDRAEGLIKTRREGGILEVTLDRPKANAIDLVTSRIMGETFRDDDSLRICILRAADEKFFCPGWDLKAANDGDAVDGDYGVGGFGGLQELPHLNKSVIATVDTLYSSEDQLEGARAFAEKRDLVWKGR